MRSIIFGFGCCLLFSATSVAAEKVSLVVDINEDMAKQIEPVKCVFDQLSEYLDVVEMPWKRAQLATESGQVDGFFIAAKSAIRDAYATYSAPMKKIDWIYVTKKPTPLRPEDADFFHLKFASTRGMRRLAWLEKHLAEKAGTQPVTAYNSATRSLFQLYKGEVDVILSTVESFEKGLAELGHSADMFNTYHQRTITGAVYFSNKFLARKPDFLKRFNQYAADCIK